MSDGNGKAGARKYADTYDLDPICVPKTLGGKKYILMEASEGAAAAFRNANIRGARFRNNKVVGVDGVADSQAILVSKCLALVDHNTGQVRRDPSGDPVTVDVAVVRRWGARVVKPLFDEVKEISDLDEKPRTPEELEAAVRSIAESTEDVEVLDALAAVIRARRNEVAEDVDREGEFNEAGDDKDDDGPDRAPAGNDLPKGGRNATTPISP